MPSQGERGSRSHSPGDASIEWIRNNLVKTRIAPDLLAVLDGTMADRPARAGRGESVILEVNSNFPGGTDGARNLLIALFTRAKLIKTRPRVSQGGLKPLSFSPVAQLAGWPALATVRGDMVDLFKSLHTDAYLFAKLAPATIAAIAALEADPPAKVHPIHKIWWDHPVQRFVYASARTVKCDAARVAFAASGADIVWAVADSGIDGNHPHFKRHGNLVLGDNLWHRDFTSMYADEAAASAGALVDEAGHGTHVAGIICGESMTAAAASPGDPDLVPSIEVVHEVRSGTGASLGTDTDVTHASISGLAPRCKLLSLKVLKGNRAGSTSDLIAAIGYLRQINGSTGNLKVHGLNLSLGYSFEAEWFAAGQSPLCLEVNRLVRSGVVVVVAAGNAGYGRVVTQRGTAEAAAHGCTIADPGNAELAITVGSTHRDMPHVYGISYFSAKGPTADGRQKPDLVAPGERIVSCTANAPGPAASFKEDTGTSMAAPHVSGVIAAFLSVRREYIERPEDVKALFVRAATDLKRRPEFQGGGLVDIMRALQSV